MHGGDEHYNLRREMPYKRSQIQFELNPADNKCLVYYEDTCTKSNDGGLNQCKVDRKVVWVYPNVENITRCPVRLVEKYLSLCPRYNKKPNFYLQSRQKTTPKVWYSGQVVGQNTPGKVVKNLLEDARIDGYFTGHSLRHTGTTRLCQAGVQKKLVKEISGHRSDAIDKYTVTSHEQRKEISNILAVKPNTTTCRELTNFPISSPEGNINIKDNEQVNKDEHSKETPSQVKVKTVQVAKSTVVRSQNVGQLVSDIVNANQNKGKTVIKIEIEITHD